MCILSLQTDGRNPLEVKGHYVSNIKVAESDMSSSLKYVTSVKL